MFELKVDDKLLYHYIIGVSVASATANDPEKLYLKYGPVCFTNDDVKNVGDACQLSEDKIYKNIYKMTNEQIYQITDCSDLIMTLTGLKLAAQINQVTLHHFSSEFEIKNPEKIFSTLVDMANVYDKERKKLNESRI